MSLEILNNPLLGDTMGSFLGDNDPKPPGSSFPVQKSPSEFKQLTIKQIANTYYNGKPVAEGNGYAIYSDEPIFGGEIEGIIVYKNKFRQTIGDIDVVLFASKNGAFLLQRYMEALPESNELALFLEIDDSYNYSTVLRAKVGAGLTNRKDLPFADILNFTREHRVTVTPEALKELIKKELYRNKVSLISWFLGLKDAAIGRIFNYFTKEIFSDAEKFFSGIATGISGLKVSENRWNPSPQEGEYAPVFIPEALYKELKKFYENENSKNPYENPEGQKKINTKIVKALFEKINNAKTYFKNLLGSAENIFPDFIYKKINKALNLFFGQIDEMEKYLIDPLTGMQHIVYKSFQIANAFLCGIYNSIIDIIAGIFSIIGFIFEAVAAMRNIADNKVEYGEMFLELMEDLVEGIMNFDYKGFFYQCITFQMRTIVRLVKWVEKAVPGFSLEKASYYYGYVIGILIDIIIETLLSGGTAAVAKLAKAVESFMLEPLGKIAQAVEKTISVTKDLLTRMLEFIRMILREFKKGVKNLFAKLERFLDEVFGFGEKVNDHALTPAEKRWKEQQERIQEKIKKKNNVERRKDVKQNKRRFENFKEKWQGRSILELSKTEIANALRGYTEQANKVAKLIEDDLMEFQILDDIEFEKMLMNSGDTLEDAQGTAAFCIGNKTFYRASTPAEKLLSEFVHEGTHTLDHIEGFIGDTYQWEKRAFFHERAFQEAVGLEKDFDTIRKMLDFIYVNY